ncbi:Probable activation/secretion signal peptide protein [Vibrio casei]|nr:Probable activation/secretion signal peptide protein [Vibrio casei]
MTVWAASLYTSFSYAKLPPLITEPQEPPPTLSESQPPDLRGPADVLESNQGYISHVHFRGGTVISDEELSSIAQPLIDTHYSIEMAKRVIGKINALYEKKGYPLSYASIAADGFHQGRLTITLIEGYVVRAEVIVDQANIQYKVNRVLKPILQEKPLTQNSLEKAILLLREIPGYRFQLALPKPKTLSGATSIRIEEVERKWIEPDLSYSYQKEGDNDLYATVTVNSLNSWIEKVSLSGLIPVDSERDTEYYAISMDHAWYDPLGIKGQLNFSRYKDNSETRLPLLGVELDVDQSKVRDRYSYSVMAPLILTTARQWKVRAKIYHTEEQNDYDVTYQDLTLDNIEQTTNYSAFSLYTNFLTSIPDFYWFSTLEVRQGVDLGANKSELSNNQGTRDFEEGDLNFTAWIVNMAVGYDMVGDVQLQVKGNGFYSDDDLVSAERVSYGGRFYGRGYPEGQAEGDVGYGAEVMLSRSFHYDLMIIDQFKPYVVADTAYTKFNSLAIEHNLSSYALGLEVSYKDAIKVAFEYAVPLDDVNIDTGRKSELYNISASWNF